MMRLLEASTKQPCVFWTQLRGHLSLEFIPDTSTRISLYITENMSYPQLEGNHCLGGPVCMLCFLIHVLFDTVPCLERAGCSLAMHVT